jgi:hypothetical protein
MKEVVLWQAVVFDGFKRVDRGSAREYKEFATYERDGVRLAFASECLHYARGVVTRYDAAGTDSITLHAVIVDLEHRRIGKARKAVGDFLVRTDERGLSVYLEPVCIRSEDSPSREVLVSFYESLGFAWADENKMVMIRNP